MSLQLPWKKYWFNFDGDFKLSCGTSIRLNFQHEKRAVEDQTDADTGNDLWDASVAMALFIDSHRDLFRNLHVLELGSGCSGLPGMVCSFAGASVTFSDLSYCLGTLSRNLALNGVNAKVIELDWSQPDYVFPVDVIIASDVIWLDALVEPFVKCVVPILNSNPKASLILSHQPRSASVDSSFFNLMESNGFKRTFLFDEGITISRFNRMYSVVEFVTSHGL